MLHFWNQIISIKIKMYYILRGKGICIKLMSPGPKNDFEDIVKIKDFICCYLEKTTQTTWFQGHITSRIPLEIGWNWIIRKETYRKDLQIWIISEIFIWSFPNWLIFETKFFHYIDQTFVTVKKILPPQLKERKICPVLQFHF